MKLKTIKKKIEELKEEHIEQNGFSVAECGYDPCWDRIRIMQLSVLLKKKLAELEK